MSLQYLLELYDELVNCFRLYNTEGLVLANYDIQDMEVPTYLGADQVLTTVANQLDINLDNYYKWLYIKKDVILTVGSNYEINLINEIKEIMPYWHDLSVTAVERCFKIHKCCLISGEGGIGKSYFIKCVEACKQLLF